MNDKFIYRVDYDKDVKFRVDMFHPYTYEERRCRFFSDNHSFDYSFSARFYTHENDLKYILKVIFGNMWYPVFLKIFELDEFELNMNDMIALLTIIQYGGYN